jgi:hypothetical protein
MPDKRGPRRVSALGPLPVQQGAETAYHETNQARGDGAESKNGGREETWSITGSIYERN